MMVRFVIIAVIVGVALVLYALVDAAMSEAARVRAVAKPVWVVIIVLLPVIGALLWLTIGKSRGAAPASSRTPDDDPRFTGTRLSAAELDAHVEELEARLRELDEEVFPGTDPGEGSGGSAANPAARGSAPEAAPDAAPPRDSANAEGDSSGEPQ